MASRLLNPVRGWEERRALRAARRRADEELSLTRLPPPRLAWRVDELVADEHRLELARSLTDAVHSADERLLPSATPLNRTAVRGCRAQLLEVAALLFDLSRPVTARGILLVEELLSGGASPLYGRSDSGRLRRHVQDAKAELDGAH